MPRRQRPLQRGASVDAAVADQFRGTIREQVLSLGIFESLSSSERERLLDDLICAVGYAKVGLADVLGGKRAKPDAWTLDIFTRDVCDALARAGVVVTMNPDPAQSDAQAIVQDIAMIAGLPGVGKMFKQMQRARKIEKHG